MSLKLDEKIKNFIVMLKAKKELSKKLRETEDLISLTEPTILDFFSINNMKHMDFNDGSLKLSSREFASQTDKTIAFLKKDKQYKESIKEVVPQAKLNEIIKEIDSSRTEEFSEKFRKTLNISKKYYLNWSNK